MTVQEVEKLWDNTSTSYHEYDCSPQSIYYSMINIMRMHKAKNVL